MNAVILYYSYKGHTKKVAEKLAHAQGAELVEIQTRKRKNLFLTYLVEAPRARMHKLAALKPVTADLSRYDLITLAAPVWAGCPAPAFNAMVRLLPEHKKVQVVLVSASGSGATRKSEEGTRKLIKKQGCTVVAYKDMREPAL